MIGCLGCEAPSVYLNLPTKQAQEELAEGLPIAVPKVRTRRMLRPALPETAAHDDYLNLPKPPPTPEEIASEEELEANLARSDWPRETPPGKIRLIWVENHGEGGIERELEFDLDDLAALHSAAMERGIHHASTDLVPASDWLSAEDPGREPQGWTNGHDSRVAKSIGSFFPANQRELK
jgi:hypothetical protein